MVIIVTGTISPSKDVMNLVLTDYKDRFEQYILCLRKMIEAKPAAKIVFCDNSGFGTDDFAEILRLAKERNVEMEVLSFEGDSAAVLKHGKGYGEGEIMKYVLENSKLAENDDYLIKITGRLIVDNIADIVKKVDRRRIYFNIPNIHRKDIYDTRLYAMPISVFKGYFIEEYCKVDDDRGYILECVYRDAVLSNKLTSHNFPCYPRIVGQSGSGGGRYEYTEWKSRIRDALSILNFYGRVCKK
ncbi:hypothetical protein SAMN02910276_02010 [Butyrivibrio sp. Su6]|uniref:hypothetical protein n=1 Tax=Butyrivibrio sp. Su6 TaxID=1520810 RepID=UPI00089EFBB2|nr:hypothetical protein [Butyrivibrio sp. Su6]SEG15587.1 hypothetical protein SAMN02910276_02010 [Butyrivibrio sp. Su6]